MSSRRTRLDRPDPRDRPAEPGADPPRRAAALCPTPAWATLGARAV